MRLNIASIVLVTLVVVATAILSFGQRTDATFAGVVTDPSGAVLPGAEIQLINERTAAVLQQVSSETGEFVFNFVPVSTYTFKIVMPGFRSYENRGIPLGAAQNVRRTYVLEVGAVTDSVTVTGEAPLVNTVSPEQRMSLETVEVHNLPMINRNITNILDVNSGLTRGEANFTGMAGTRFRLNGLGGSSMNVTANGTDANGNAGSMVISGYGQYNKIEVMSAEAIAEVQIVKGVIPAEYGSAMAGTMSVISKSGTNQWHGSIFHRYEGSVLSARQPFLAHEANSVWNQFGGSLGGPILRDKLFFFVAYEGYRQRTTIALPNAASVPTQRFRDIMMTSLRFPETKLFLDHLPLPNQPHASDALLGLWVGGTLKRNDDDHKDARVDYMIGGGNLSVTYYGGHPYQEQALSQPLNPQTTYSFLKRMSSNYTLGRGRWTSQTRVGMNQSFVERIDKIWFTKDPNKPESTPGGRLLPIIQYPGMTGFNRENRSTGPIPSWSFDQQIALFRGTHSWKFGGIFALPRGGQPDTTALPVSYLTLPDVMRNEPSSTFYEANKHPFTWSMKNFGLFLQDDWRFSQKLVLNLGVRYDRYGRYTVHDWKGPFGRTLQSYNYTPEQLKNFEGKLPMGLYNLEGLLDSVNFLWGPLRDKRKGAHDSDNFSLGPRFGFAYTADSRGDFVIRGGFGVNFQSYDPTTYDEFIQRTVELPDRRTFTRAESAALGLRWPLYEEDVTKLIQAEGNVLGGIGRRYNPHMVPPYAMNYTLGFQRALTRSLVLETAYVGTRGVKFNLYRNFNDVDRVTGLRPNPNDITGPYLDNSGQSNYNSWQTSLRQRMTRGLLFNLHHTWGKALSYNGGDVAPGHIGDSRGDVQDFALVKLERALSTGDIMHYVAADWVYEVPGLFRNSRAAQAVLGGWQFSGIFRANSGPALGVTQTGGRPDILDIKNQVNKECCGFGRLQYLNPAAYRLVPVSSASSRTVRRGEANATPLRAPGNWNVDFSLGKNFPITEGKTFELKADLQNALNHTQYINVSTNLSGINFGQVNGTRTARVVQLQLRFAF